MHDKEMLRDMKLTHASLDDAICRIEIAMQCGMVTGPFQLLFAPIVWCIAVGTSKILSFVIKALERADAD